ncbi:MAG: hypothetical protein M3R38_05230 [Actinomycetota bacterium]|nr:hypothetical protein [Actinomycetota bacterium]
MNLAKQALREQSGRYPLVFDDLKKERFTKYAAPLIKTDYLPSDEYPVTVLSMNNQQDAFDDDVRKRALMIYAGTSMPSYTAEASELSKRPQGSGAISATPSTGSTWTARSPA